MYTFIPKHCYDASFAEALTCPVCGSESLEIASCRKGIRLAKLLCPEGHVLDLALAERTALARLKEANGSKEAFFASVPMGGVCLAMVPEDKYDYRSYVYRHVFPDGRSYVGVTSKDLAERWQGRYCARMAAARDSHDFRDVGHYVWASDLSDGEARPGDPGTDLAGRWEPWDRAELGEFDGAVRHCRPRAERIEAALIAEDKARNGGMNLNTMPGNRAAPRDSQEGRKDE